ncbi:MAG: hypothetical protein ROO71_09960 [Balneola sp.]
MKRTAKRKPKNSDGKPRYPDNKYQLYHQIYKKLVNNSIILNDKKRANDLYNSTALYGIGECEGTLLELVGSRDGYYLRSNNWYKALIPIAKQTLKEVHKEFKRWQIEQVKKGYSLERPKEWQKELLEKRLKAEALYDVRLLEKKAIENRIKELKLKQEKERSKEILPNGTQGRIGYSGNRIIEVDKQKVSYSNGIPFIDESQSPYNGMPIVYYRDMCEQWKIDVGITAEQLRKKRDEIYASDRKKAYKEGKEPPVVKLPVSGRSLPVWMERLGITKSDYPKWPKNAKHISEFNK